MASVADLDFCYLTTVGRQTGLERTIEIWFVLDGDILYMLSGGGDHSHWVRNLRHNPAVSVQLGTQTRGGMARIVVDEAEDGRARRLLAAKYQGWTEGRRLSGWARTALPVAIDLRRSTRR